LEWIVSDSVTFKKPALVKKTGEDLKQAESVQLTAEELEDVS
jgi:hypothetical protein